jgi:hypothetical protein
MTPSLPHRLRKWRRTFNHLDPGDDLLDDPLASAVQFLQSHSRVHSQAVSTNADRRRHARVTPRPNEPITIRVLGKKLVEILWARDISVGGVAVLIHHDVDATTLANEVDIMVGLPDRPAFKARAQVRHIATSSMFGVQFTLIKPEDVAAIEAYVAQRVAEGGLAP